MGSYETKKINTGKYNTFFCEGGEANSETLKIPYKFMRCR